MVVLDTTEYMRNSDYFPTRLFAEKESAYGVFNQKMSANPQSGVGLMTLDGNVKVSFVQRSGPFRAAVDETNIEKVNKPAFSKAIQVAQLALRHRHPTQRQRIVVYVGSPIEETEDELRKLGGRLKKNGVAIDIIAFGQEGENSALLSGFVAAANSSDSSHASHFLDVPPGIEELATVVARSPVCGRSQEDDNSFLGDDFGMDDDPELMMALRMSLEEERQRVASQAQ